MSAADDDADRARARASPRPRRSCAGTTSGCSRSPGPAGSARRASPTRSPRRSADQFADGVVLVPLQSVSDPGHVIGTIARSLGLFDGEGDLEQRLVAHIEGRRLLLVVDNFEQVVDAAPSLAAIVAASPSLKVAVTSRTRLRVRGEQELPLEPLTRDAAVAVFLERARAVRPDFQPDEADLDAIARDLRPARLPAARDRARRGAGQAAVPDGDARPPGAPPRAPHLGVADAPVRHRALRDTIGWSVELLDDDREGALPPPLRLRRRLHARGGRGGVRRRSRRPRLARRQEPRPRRR